MDESKTGQNEVLIAAEVPITAAWTTDSGTEVDINRVGVSETQASDTTAAWAPESTSTAAEANPTALPGHVLTDDCRCGCIPNIMSLFQMAALRAERKAARKKAEAEAAALAKESEKVIT